MGLVVVKRFLSRSVSAIAARRVDRVEFLEIEVGDCLELVDQSRSFEVVWQVVEPGAVFVLQSDQRRYRCCPASGPWREPRRRRGGGVGRSVGAAWHGVAPAARQGSAASCGCDVWNTDLRLSNVTVTFPGWLGRRSGLLFDDKRLLASDRPRGVRHQGANIAPQTCIRWALLRAEP